MTKERNNSKYIKLLALASGLAILTGCGSYEKQSAGMYGAWQSGNAETATIEVTKQAEKAAGSRDELLWRLEQGTIMATAGNLEGSTEAFNTAEEIVNKYEEQAKVKVASKGASLLTNQTVLPYRGRGYDKIMMNTYKALNLMQLQDFDGARVELNRTFQRQSDAVAENQKRIEEAVAKAEASKEGNLTGEDGKSAPKYDVEKAQQDPKFAAASGEMLADIEKRILPYADYVNPFSVFLDGVYFTHAGLDSADVERARKSFERVRSMSPGSYIDQDYVMAEQLADGVQPAPLTYVLFATGSAPTRDEIRIDIPLFLVSSVSYAGAAFPKLQYHENYIPQLTAIDDNGNTHVSERLCSMDAVISKDFKNAWPSVLTNTLLTTATKAIAGKLLEDSVRNEDWKVRLIAKAANIGFQAATNRADLRTWTTLPKEFAYVRIPTPESGVTQLKIGLHEATVEVAPGKTNVIMVRSVNQMTVPVVNSFTLN